MGIDCVGLGRGGSGLGRAPGENQDNSEKKIYFVNNVTFENLNRM